jgi:hypothetical protein
MKIYFKGKMSTFGGPHDFGVRPTEGLALVHAHNRHHYDEYFLGNQPVGTTGMARRLNPDKFYVACRWNYHATPKQALSMILVEVTNPANGKRAYAKPIDWGPDETTRRVADLSPGLARHLGLDSDADPYLVASAKVLGSDVPFVWRSLPESGGFP